MDRTQAVTEGENEMWAGETFVSSVCENKNLKHKVGEMVDNLGVRNPIIKDRELR